MTRTGCGLGACLPALLVMLPALAQPLGPAEPPQQVEVTGRRMTEELPADRPTTVLGRETIERRQAENIFDVLKGLPGLGVEGGPRTTGMKFSLRGFNDNEDVLFKIDGAVKGFEKYRFGSGVLLDPELINSLTVERGPAVTSGSGALGGTISARTKSAVDLLRPGETYGGLVKVGYNDNNHERLRLVAGFGRPGPFDVLVAVVRRDSQDIQLSDNSLLPVSATHSESRLAKVGWFPHERLNFELGYISYDSGPERQPYDVTGGPPGVGGIVRRTLDDATTTLRFDWNSPYELNLRGVISKERTQLNDEHRNFDEEGRREGRICVNTLPATSRFSVARCDDLWRYDITNAEVFGETRFKAGAFAGEVVLGVQGQDSRRDTSRVTSNVNLNETNFPGGFNPDQPAGDKVSAAAVAEARLRWDDWTLVPGMRRDQYTVSSRGQARANMEAVGQDPDIDFSKTLMSLGLTWQPNRGAWSFTGRVNEGFRPPLIDEYFGDGSSTSTRPNGRCRPTSGDPTLPNAPVTASAAQPLYDPAGIGLAYDPARDLAPLNGICGGLYRPQESVSRELIIAWQPAPAGGYAWTTRLTVYRIRTDHLLSSLRWVNGEAGQPGVEHRRGVELEAEMRSRTLFASMSYGQVRREGNEDATTGAAAIESFSVPADATVLTLGSRIGDSASVGWRVRHLAERKAYVSAQTPVQCYSNADSEGVATQNGVTLNEIFGQWQINRMFALRASVDNLDNRDHCLVSSFSGAVGFRAPGRAAKLSLTAQF